MGTSGLPDIYTRSPRAAGLRAAWGVYIRRTTSAHGITTMYHFALIVRDTVQEWLHHIYV